MSSVFFPSRRAWLALALAAAAPLALAHVTLAQPRAVAGQTYKAVFQVGHACAGSRRTTAITVRIPDGFRGAQPMPKPGWTLSLRRAALAQPYEAHGRQVSEDVVELRWQAQDPDTALPADYYDEFVLRGTPVGAPGPLWFKVLQSCDAGQADWAEVPASGSSTRGLQAPAALLELLPAEAPAHVH